MTTAARKPLVAFPHLDLMCREPGESLGPEHVASTTKEALSVAPPVPDPLLRKPAVCRALAISPATLDRLVASGRLRRLKIGPRISVYRTSEVMALPERLAAEVAQKAGVA
jgi:predicted DNA-binding transcriptional regulator AlpA